MRLRWLVLSALLVALIPAGVRAQAVGPGSPAPALTVGAFVKGQPVRKFEKGKIYVVEFWATWCGPCRQSIPHLSALQKKYPQVTMIGVSVWENDQKDVKPFLAEMGSKMAYRVATDLVPARADSRDGKMATGWMKAAGQTGVPSAFIVDGSGTIAWVGHPMEMDEPLAKVVAGTWNVKAAAAARRAERAEKEQMQGLQQEMQAAGKDPKRMLAVLNKAIRTNPKLEDAVGFGKLRLLQETKDTAGGLAYARHLVSTVYKSNPQALNAIAWSLVAPELKPAPAPAAVALALDAAKKADTMVKFKEPAVAHTLARAYFVKGDRQKALQTQERAVRLGKGTEADKQLGLQTRLAEYRKAAK
jgi:thiol-disulfide isomerase/thioredoxin